MYKDPRNFETQLSGADLSADKIGLEGSLVADLRYWLVVSYGDFNIETSANILSKSSIDAPSAPPRRHATVAYVLLGAVSGQYKGEEFKYAGCTD
jgi:hypothetical protein